jgi:hypothetical protein
LKANGLGKKHQKSQVQTCPSLTDINKIYVRDFTFYVRIIGDISHKWPEEVGEAIYTYDWRNSSGMFGNCTKIEALPRAMSSLSSEILPAA